MLDLSAVTPTHTCAERFPHNQGSYISNHRASLDEQATQAFISKRIPSGWKFDESGRDIPQIDSTALDILERLSKPTRQRIFTAASFDIHDNYDDLEFLGDAALRFSVSHWIERKHPELSRGFRSVRSKHLLCCHETDR
jgi:dsRNA-specific ribonuclease